MGSCRSHPGPQSQLKQVPSKPSHPTKFRWSWVLRDQLAVGPAPRYVEHLDELAEAGILAVLSLCDEKEAPAPQGMEQRFTCRRLVLPDHHAGRPPKPQELELALSLLNELEPQGPMYVHCLAGVERSPLVCLGWLMRSRRLPLLAALEYMMRVHPSTGPLPEQLACLRSLN
jgi:protein-tyrosine phosphatase